MGVIDSLMDATKAAFKHYFNFSGRSTRSHFWYYSLFLFLASLVAGVLDGIFFPQMLQDINSIGTPINSVLSLATLIPSISITTRRLHDINKSGWWQLIMLTIVGIIPLIYWMCVRSDEGDNRFGPKPSMGTTA